MGDAAHWHYVPQKAAPAILKSPTFELLPNCQHHLPMVGMFCPAPCLSHLYHSNHSDSATKPSSTNDAIPILVSPINPSTHVVRLHTANVGTSSASYDFLASACPAATISSTECLPRPSWLAREARYMLWFCDGWSLTVDAVHMER